MPTRERTLNIGQLEIMRMRTVDGAAAAIKEWKTHFKIISRV